MSVVVVFDRALFEEKIDGFEESRENYARRKSAGKELPKQVHLLLEITDSKYN